MSEKYHMYEISREEAKKAAKSHFYDPFCISMSGVYETIYKSAHNGYSDCSLTVPEEHLYQFKKELRDKGFTVYSEQILFSDIPPNCSNNIFDRYPSYKDIYHLEIEWS